MKVLILLCLIFQTNVLNANCERYLTPIDSPSSSIFASKNKVNLWSEHFSPSKLLEEHRQFNANQFFSDLSQISDRSTTFEDNVLSLLNKLLIDQKINQTTYNTLRNQFLNHPQRRAFIQELPDLPHLHDALMESKLRDTNISELKKILQGVNLESDNGERLTQYIHFLNTVDLPQLEQALKAIPLLYQGSTSNTFLRKFARYQRKISNFSSNIEARLITRYTNENGGQLTTRLQERIAREVKAKGSQYQSLLYSCRNRNYNSANSISGNKRFLAFVTGSSIVNTGIGYTMEHWEERNQQGWWRGLAFEVVLESFLVWYYSKISTDQSLSFVAKNFQAYRAAAAIDIFDSVAYQVLVAPPHTSSQLPPESEQIKHLFNHFEAQNFHTEFTRRLKTMFNASSTDPRVITENEFDQLGHTDLVLQYLALQSNYVSENGYQSFHAMHGVQRYEFNRKWELAEVPTNIIFNQMVYQIMCMAEMNYPAALITSSAMVLGHDFIASKLYYALRNDSIGF